MIICVKSLHRDQGKMSKRPRVPPPPKCISIGLHALTIFWELGIKRRVKDARLMVDNINAFTTIDERSGNGQQLQLNRYYASIKRTKAAFNIILQWTTGMKMLADPLTKKTKTKTLLATIRKNEFQFEFPHTFVCPLRQICDRYFHNSLKIITYRSEIEHKPCLSHQE